MRALQPSYTVLPVRIVQLAPRSSRPHAFGCHGLVDDETLQLSPCLPLWGSRYANAVPRILGKVCVTILRHDFSALPCGSLFTASPPLPFVLLHIWLDSSDLWRRRKRGAVNPAPCTPSNQPSQHRTLALGIIAGGHMLSHVPCLREGTGVLWFCRAGQCDSLAHGYWVYGR